MKRCLGFVMIFGISLAAYASAQTELVVYSFAGGKAEAFPLSALVADSEGNLYGTTVEGGKNNYGTVFELIPTKKGFRQRILHSFKGADGTNPYAKLTFDGNGNLYGTAYYGGTRNCDSAGCGTVFKLSPTAHGWKETTVYRFEGGSDGAFPASEVIFDSAGNMYGTTSSGGGTLTGACGQDGYVGCGTVFQLTETQKGTWNEMVLHAFTGNDDGEFLYAGLVLDSLGNLYGTTEEGGNAGCFASLGCGTAFTLSPRYGVWAKSTIYTFSGGTDAGGPSGSLVFDVSGNLYGTSISGGAIGSGTVYQLSPAHGGWTESVIHGFGGAGDGQLPADELVFDQYGALYGTTVYGGATGWGTVFKMTPSQGSWTESILHSFAAGVDGQNPWAGLLYFDGDLWGTTEEGGGNGCFELGCGVVFKIVP